MAVVTSDPWTAQLEAMGAFIRAQRQTAGLSLRDLAGRTHVSNAYLSQIERGLHEPSLSVLRAVAAALGVPVEALLARAGVLEEGDGEAAPVRATEAAILPTPRCPSRSGSRC